MRGWGGALWRTDSTVLVGAVGRCGKRFDTALALSMLKLLEVVVLTVDCWLMSVNGGVRKDTFLG